CNRFVLARELANETDRLAAGAQSVGVCDAARQHKGVEILRPGIANIHLHIERVDERQMIEALDRLALFLWRYQRDLGAVVFKKSPWLCVFDLLDAIGHQDGDSFPL